MSFNWDAYERLGEFDGIIHWSQLLDMIAHGRALQAERDGYKKALESIALIENQLVGFDWEEIDAARDIANAALAAGRGK